MKFVVVFRLVFFLAIATFAQCKKASAIVRTAKKSGQIEGESLVGYLFKEFRRSLDFGGEWQEKNLESSGLLVIRGLQFRSVQRASGFTSSINYSSSDYHFFGLPIPSEYHLYVLADMKDTAGSFQSTSVQQLGRCKAGRPPGNSSAPGVREMMSATNEEMHKWLLTNEAKYEEEHKLCALEVLTATRVQNFVDWAPLGSPSNYTLLEFEWSEQQKLASGERQPDGYIYLRATKQNENSSNNNNNLIDSREVWLIASSHRVNFSVSWTAKDKADPFDKGGDNDCKEGFQIQVNAEGYAEYVSNHQLSSEALQLFAAPGGELLIAPHAELCFKFCVPVPRFVSWFVDAEARCPNVAEGLKFPNSARVLNAISKFNCHGYKSWKSESGTQTSNSCVAANAAGHQGKVGVGSLSDLLFQQMRWESNEFIHERLCLPLEHRYEPMAFINRQRSQKNLYYRFGVLSLGDKRCCCF